MHTDPSGLQPPSNLKFSPVPAPSQELKNEASFQHCKYPIQLWKASNQHKMNGVQRVARLKPERSFKLGPDKHQPEPDCQFS